MWTQCQPPNPALTQTQQNSGLKDNVEVAKGGEDAPEDHHFKRDWLLMDCIIALLNVPLLFLAITIVKVENRTKLDLLVAPHEPYHDSFIHPNNVDLSFHELFVVRRLKTTYFTVNAFPGLLRLNARTCSVMLGGMGLCIHKTLSFNFFWPATVRIENFPETHNGMRLRFKSTGANIHVSPRTFVDSNWTLDNQLFDWNYIGQRERHETPHRHSAWPGARLITQTHAQTPRTTPPRNNHWGLAPANPTAGGGIRGIHFEPRDSFRAEDSFSPVPVPKPRPGGDEDKGQRTKVIPEHDGFLV